MATCHSVTTRTFQTFLFIALVAVSAAPAPACTSFMLETDGGIYFAHSLNQCSMERVEGHVFINPRDTWKRGYGFPVLLGESPIRTRNSYGARCTARSRSIPSVARCPTVG